MKRLITHLALAAVRHPVVGCAGLSSSPELPTVTHQPGHAARPSVEVVPGFAGIGPKDPNIIGGCCFWEAVQSSDGHDVTFEVGWGDCQSGCIERHRWTYSVSSNGAVTLVAESGEPVPSGVPGPGGGSPGGGTTGGIPPGGTGIQGRVLPADLPVVTVNEPSCNTAHAGATFWSLDTAARGRAFVTTPTANYRSPSRGPIHDRSTAGRRVLRFAEPVGHRRERRGERRHRVRHGIR